MGALTIELIADRSSSGPVIGIKKKVARKVKNNAF
jgi:hypothetical protein